MKLLVDGDILLYRCAFAAEKTHYLVEAESCDAPGFMHHPDHKSAKADAEKNNGVIWSRKEIQPVEFAINATNTVLESLVQRFEPESVDVFLSDGQTFRHRLATTKPYKGNREAPKPVYYNDIRDYLLSRGAIIIPDIEADDCLAIEATKDRPGTIMVTIDKDLLQVPGNHYNWVTQEQRTQTAKDADFELFTQLLTGDRTDNVPGLDGFGPVRARKALEGARSRKDLLDRVEKEYKESYGEQYEDYLGEQFALIYLLRNYDQKKVLEDAALPTAEQIGSALQGAAR